MAKVHRTLGPPVELPAALDDAEYAALRALQAGNAGPEQQRQALRCIVEKMSGAYEVSYRHGESGDRDTAFAEGRRFVGLQIIRQLNSIRTTKEGK